ncbi:MAG: hypothetical protein IT184_01680 [Acidobacteria bacterium]|nr:hypothetical protein [Acidobacteriota bacterium]
MSARTAPALAALDRFLPQIAVLSPGSARDRLQQETEALRRAVAAFHMEAIRFRMYNVDRLVRALGDGVDLRGLFDDVRRELEHAGFHTRSHAAP